MGETKNIRLNRLPAITWYWLNMNEASVEADLEGPVDAQAEAPRGVSFREEKKDLFPDQPTGAGSAFCKAAESAADSVQVWSAAEGVKTTEPLRLKYQYKDGDKALNLVNIVAEKDSDMTVVMDYTSDPEASGAAAVQTRFSVGENAVLRLVQIVRVGQKFSFINDLGGRAGDRARVEVIHVVLSGDKVYQGYQIDLAGEKSSLKTDIAYQVAGDGHLDMNYFANHTGRKTECEINVNGVLRDRASKILRATIDLKRGAVGAVGNEKEDVLLMDDGVRNQTIPLILCTEEDVVGNHGATIGRLDESLMFYLESRGLNKEEIYEMMAKARIDATVRMIPDEKTKEEINAYLGGGTEDDRD
ncbi:MAG: SufB/SufD family protein [Bilifractor sp.]